MALARFRWIGNEASPRTAEWLRQRGNGESSLLGDRGFSLIEVLAATTILTVALAALAQLFAISAKSNSSAKATTFASVLAQQKMEQLRGLTWGYDALGLPLTDTTTNISVMPETAGGHGLTPSPTAALSQNTVGYCDFL